MIPKEIAEQFTEAVLTILRNNRTRFGLEASAIAVFVKPLGFYPNGNDTVDRLEYLVMKGLAEELVKNIGSTRAWRITDAGRRYLDEHNL